MPRIQMQATRIRCLCSHLCYRDRVIRYTRTSKAEYCRTTPWYKVEHKCSHILTVQASDMMAVTQAHYYRCNHGISSFYVSELVRDVVYMVPCMEFEKVPQEQARADCGTSFLSISARRIAHNLCTTTQANSNRYRPLSLFHAVYGQPLPIVESRDIQKTSCLHDRCDGKACEV